MTKDLVPPDWGERMKDQFNLPEWHYREIPWITQELFSELVELIGSDNIRIIGGSKMSTNGVNTCRASVLISPEGMKNLDSKKSEA